MSSLIPGLDSTARSTEQYPKIDLVRKPGYPFAIAFLFIPKGTICVTGDLGSIRDYAIKNLPLCHGYWYFPKRKAEIEFKRQHRMRDRGMKSGIWDLFGPNTISTGSRSGKGIIYLDHLHHWDFQGMRSYRTNGFSDGVRQLVNKHPRYVLWQWEFDSNNKAVSKKFITSFRKFPRTYLRELKDFQNGIYSSNV